MSSAATLLLAALTWDPELRGALIVVVAVSILCGSVYLLLMTNTGSRLGFLLSMAGLVGWMAVMGWVWVGYGIGLKGHPPSWHVQEVVTGDEVAELATVGAINDDFPNGWKRLELGDPILGEAQASADHVLIPQTGGGGHGEAGAPEPSRFEPVFEELDDYTLVTAYRKGGEDFYIPGGYLERSQGFMKGWFHKPHYAVIEVKPVIAEPDLGGAPAAPTADVSEDSTYVIMLRDLGNVRFPSFVFAVANTILFGVFAYMLHERDKRVMAARAQATTT